MDISSSGLVSIYIIHTYTYYTIYTVHTYISYITNNNYCSYRL